MSFLESKNIRITTCEEGDTSVTRNGCVDLFHLQGLSFPFPRCFSRLFSVLPDMNVRDLARKVPHRILAASMSVRRATGLDSIPSVHPAAGNSSCFLPM